MFLDMNLPDKSLQEKFERDGMFPLKKVNNSFLMAKLTVLLLLGMWILFNNGI